MLMPKRVKRRKQFRGTMKGKALRGNTIAYGEYGIVAAEPCWIRSNQIEAARVAMTRYIKRGGKVWIKIFPDKPVTAKPAETRMGSGKGALEYWVAVVKPGRVTSQSYFCTRGWTRSVSGNSFGFTSPRSSEDMSWNFSPFAGPWLATHLWNYYDFTRDRHFLADNYDMLKESADFAADYLWHRADGVYTAAPSTSPEHGPVDEGATFAHAVIREVLLDAIEASRVLGKSAKERRQWEDALKHLAPYKIGRYGQLMEWSTDIDDPKDEHRHVNHLFGLHPGRTVSPVTTPELAKASRVVLEHRGDGNSTSGHACTTAIMPTRSTAIC